MRVRTVLFLLFVFFIRPALAAFEVEVVWHKEHVYSISEDSITVLELADMISEMDRKAIKYAIVPVAAIKHRNENVKEISALFLCLPQSLWEHHELEKACRIRFFETIDGLKIPANENWLFVSEVDAMRVGGLAAQEPSEKAER